MYSCLCAKLHPDRVRRCIREPPNIPNLVTVAVFCSVRRRDTDTTCLRTDAVLSVANAGR